MDAQVPVPLERFDLVMGDGAVIRVRRHGRTDGMRLFVSNGNGFAVDGYYPAICCRSRSPRNAGGRC